MLFVLELALLIWRGFVIKMLWGWFLVPLGVPAISIALACGLLILLGISTQKISDNVETYYSKAKYNDKIVISTVFWGIGGLAMLLFGYGFHLLVGMGF
jgi:hypothetical protein